MRKGRYTFWIRVPGESTDLYVCVTHVPVYRAPGRKAAFDEIGEGYKFFRALGLVVIGGDFNSRCALNGDPILDTSGRHLIDFCQEHSLTIVNSLAVCEGEFSREQVVLGSWVRTTIDYVLIMDHAEDVVRKLRLNDLEPESDHKKLTLELGWRPARVVKNKEAEKKHSLHTKWKIHEADEAKWQQYEDRCEEEMVQWVADFEARTAQDGSEQQVVDKGLKTIVEAFNVAASATVGKKRVGPSSKAFISREMADLLELRREAARELRAVPTDVTHSKEKAALIEINARLKREARCEKKKALGRLFRDIESWKTAVQTLEGPSQVTIIRWQCFLILP